MLSTGIDMMKISSVISLLEDAAAAPEVFTPRELEYIRNGDERPEHRAAGIFCAKEAVAKALGVGFSVMTPFDIEITHDEHGAPWAVCSQESGFASVGRINISISHSGEYAVASAIIFTP